MKAHTPGPWHLGIRPGPIIYGPLGEQVADLRGLTLEKHESIANAHLVASAPDLLASLIELESMVAEMLPKHGPCGWGELALNQAREAIAKAKGNP